MPFIAADAEFFYEMEGGFPREGLPPVKRLKRAFEDFEYAEARAVLSEEGLKPASRLLVEALRAIGVIGLKGSYDGGCDEGWAHPLEVVFEKGAREVKVVCAELAGTELVAAARKLFVGQRPWIGDKSAEGVVMYLMDDLAMEAASALLGGGFGTGEYVIYGDFAMDFRSGVIVDDPGAMRRRP